MATPVHRSGLRSRQIVEPAPPTKSRRQVAAEKKAEKETKERKKNEGLKKIATVENAKAQEQAASTKTPCLLPPKKSLKKTSRKRRQAPSNPSSDVADHGHTALSEDIETNQECHSETEGATMVSDVPADLEPCTRDDSASEAVSVLDATQKKKRKKVSLRVTINDLRNQLMVVDPEDYEVSSSASLDQKTPTVAWVKCGHQNIDISICHPLLIPKQSSTYREYFRMTRENLQRRKGSYRQRQRDPETQMRIPLRCPSVPGPRTFIMQGATLT